MNRRWRILATLVLPLGVAAILGAFGCSSDNTTKPPEELAPPTNLKAVNGSAAITLTWTASPDEGRSDFSSYSVYRSTSSMSLTTVPPDANRIGSAVKGSGQFIDSSAADTTLYYYQVRSKAGSSISVGNSEVRGIRRPEGTGIIIEEFAGNLASAFNFALGDSVSLRQSNPDRFTQTDFYLGTTDTQNDPGSPLALKSPSTLAELGDQQWATHITTIGVLGTDWTVASGAQPTSDFQTVAEDNVYVFKMLSNHYGKIQVTAISGTAPNRVIQFRYAYQPKAGLYLL